MAGVATTQTLLELQQLGISFGQKGTAERHWILRDLDLTVREGEFVTIMGSSGAGKSTLLNAIAQTLQPSAGTILFKGRAVGGAGMPTAPGSNRQIGYVTQDDNLLPWRTVWDNVMFPLTLVGRPGAAETERARRLLEQVGLSEWANHHPHQLSGGMRRRASLARTLVYNPPVVLMDEPFGALDAETRAQLQSDLLLLWQAERKTILFVTHDINEAIALGDRVVLLSGSPGRIVLDRQIDIPRPRDPELDIFSEIVAADEARYQALYAQDAATLKDMLRDDYLHTHANGKTDDKEAFLAFIRAARYRFVRAERTGQRVRTAGPIALLSGNTETTLDMGGELKTICSAFVTAWTKEGGRWKLLHWQATKLPQI